MKYYCKNCGNEWRQEQKPNKGYTKIPDYETPQQYEKRTGKAFSDEGIVWVLWNDGVALKWRFLTYGAAKRDNCAREWDGYVFAISIVIADPPVPPPDTWRPEA